MPLGDQEIGLFGLPQSTARYALVALKLLLCPIAGDPGGFPLLPLGPVHPPRLVGADDAREGPLRAFLGPRPAALDGLGPHGDATPINPPCLRVQEAPLQRRP